MGNGINSTTHADMRALLIHASEHDLLTVDDWHSLFFWKPHSKKQFHHSEFSTLEINDGLQRFWARHDTFYAKACFDECIAAITSVNPSIQYSQATDYSETEYPMASYLIVMYERTVSSPHLEELSDLQEAMESCLSKLSDLEGQRENSRKGMKSLFRKTREASTREVEEATKVINELIAEFDRLVIRLKELRVAVQCG